MQSNHEVATVKIDELTQNLMQRNHEAVTVKIDELLGALRHSNIPNIVVEGKGDIIIYRELEDRFGIGTVGIYHAGGRPQLLEIYDTLSESEKNGDFSHAPVAFIADRDMLVFKNIPAQYKDIIWTEGYSIENDLYLIGQLNKLVKRSLSQSEYAEYEKALDYVCAWFAEKVEKYLEQNPGKLNSIDDNTVQVNVYWKQIIDVDENDPKLIKGLKSSVDFLPLDNEKVQAIKNAYNCKLRGKLLFQLLAYFLSKPAIGFSDAKINTHALYNVAITFSNLDKLFSRLEREVKEKLHKQREKKESQKSPS